MVKISLYPFDAATMASPIPVLPLVGSTSVDLPGEISPRASASWIILSAIRSFTELAGLDDSSLATISATHPDVTLVILTRGVCPISSRMLDAIFGRSGVAESEEVALCVVVVVVAVVGGVVKACAVPTKKRAEAYARNFMVDDEWAWPSVG